MELPDLLYLILLILLLPLVWAMDIFMDTCFFLVETAPYARHHLFRLAIRVQRRCYLSFRRLFPRSLSPAARAVFETPELLESILSHLPEHKILLATQVCKTFKHTIKNSGSLQRMLWMRAAPADETDLPPSNPLVKLISKHWEDVRSRPPASCSKVRCRLSTLCNRLFRPRMRAWAAPQVTYYPGFDGWPPSSGVSIPDAAWARHFLRHVHSFSWTKMLHSKTLEPIYLTLMWERMSGNERSERGLERGEYVFMALKLRPCTLGHIWSIALKLALRDPLLRPAMGCGCLVGLAGNYDGIKAEDLNGMREYGHELTKEELDLIMVEPRYSHEMSCEYTDYMV